MDDGRVRGSFAETLKFFLDSIKVGDSSTTKPILFVLEEFDEFTSHTGQVVGFATCEDIPMIWK